MGRWGIAAIAFALLLFSRDTDADLARPLRFWVAVTPVAGGGQQHIYAWTAGAAVPTALVGWTCKMGTIDLAQMPAMAATAGLPAVPAMVGQSADLVCTSASGSVEGTALCEFQADDENEGEELKIKDVAGHFVWLRAGCRN